MSKLFQIEFYEDKNGKCEIKEYLFQLQNNNNKENSIKFNKITMYIELLSRYGLKLGEPYIKKINKNIWELRPARDRILFASMYNNRFILLNYFMKQTQKTPKREIKKAQKLLDDYIRRSNYE